MNLAKECRQRNGHSNKGDATTNSHQDCLFDILVTILHLKIDVECTYKCNDSSNRIKKRLYRTLIRAKSCCSLANSSYPPIALGVGEGR